MNRHMFCRLLLTAWALVVAGEVQAELPAVRKVQLKYTCEIAEVPLGSKTVDLWIPMLADNDRQTIRLLSTTEPSPGRITKDKTFGNQLYYQRFEAPAGLIGPIKIEFLYDVEVHEETVAAAKQLISTKSDVPAGKFDAYLQESQMIPIKGRITELARGITLPDGEPLLAGRKIYDYLVDTMKYNYLRPERERATPSGHAIARPVTAPTLIPSLSACVAGEEFRPIMYSACRFRRTSPRAISSIVIAGLNFGSPTWAGFRSTPALNKFPKDREYYFGTLGSTWITLAHGRDVVLEPPQQGPPINMLHGPVAEIDGRPFEHVHWKGHYRDQQVTTAK